MADSKIKLHVHVWDCDVDDSNPIESTDLTVRDVYAPDYIQFGGQIQGKYVELRLFIEDLLELVEMSNE